MTKNELIAKIKNGSDILFKVRNKGYTILTWTDEGIRILEWNKPETARYYKTERELVDNFLVDGTPLGELAAEVVITEYT